MSALERRQAAVLSRLLRLEVLHACQVARRAPRDADGGLDVAWGAEQASLGPAHELLRTELERKAVRAYRFVRVPHNYYDTPLEERRRCLRAHTCAHLCKTITVENTAWTPLPDRPAGELADSLNPRFLLVVVQYARRFDVEKLRAWLYDANAGLLAKKRINPRLASAAESERLTGFRTGGVTPVAVATPELPIVLSHEIARLNPPLFWLGAADVDLKVRRASSGAVLALQGLRKSSAAVRTPDLALVLHPCSFACA